MEITELRCKSCGAPLAAENVVERLVIEKYGQLTERVKELVKARLGRQTLPKEIEAARAHVERLAAPEAILAGWQELFASLESIESLALAAAGAPR